MENSTSNGTDVPLYYYYYNTNQQFSLWVFIPNGYIVVRDFAYRYITFIVWLVSFFGNSLIVGILFRKNNRHFSTSIYLTGLAAADLTVNTSATLYTGLTYLGLIGTQRHSDMDCKLRGIIPFAAGFISAWMLAVISIERVLSVCVPHKIKRLCTLSTARVVTLLVWFIFLGLGAAHENMLYFVRLTENSGLCMVEPKYRDIYFTYVVWTGYILRFILPYAIILLSTVSIITVLVRRNVLNKAVKKTSRTVNVILLNVNIVFLVLTTPYIVVYMFAENIIFDKYDFKEWAYYYFWIEILKIVMDINSAVNVFVYFLSGSRFRKEVLEAIVAGKRFVLSCCRN